MRKFLKCLSDILTYCRFDFKTTTQRTGKPAKQQQLCGVAVLKGLSACAGIERKCELPGHVCVFKGILSPDPDMVFSVYMKQMKME